MPICTSCGHPAHLLNAPQNNYSSSPTFSCTRELHVQNAAVLPSSFRPFSGRFLVGFRWQINGQPTGSLVATLPGLHLAGIRSPISFPFCPFLSFHVTLGRHLAFRGRHGHRELIPTPDEVAICIPKGRHLCQTATICCASLIGQFWLENYKIIPSVGLNGNLPWSGGVLVICHP